MGNAYVRLSEKGARHYINNSTRPNSGRVFYCLDFKTIQLVLCELLENVIDVHLWYNKSIMALY